MRKTVLAITIVAMATPVCAQISPNLAGGSAKPKTDVDVRQEQEREAGYKAGVSRIPDAKGKVDPWGGVRGAATSSSGQTQSRQNAK